MKGRLDESPDAPILPGNRGDQAMPPHEYRVVPAPRRGLKAKGLRRPEDRFARTVEGEMNRMAAEGWEFVRSDTLPCERKPGWFSRPVTVFETLLIFRRDLAEARGEAPAMPPLMAPPMAEAPPPYVAAPAATRAAPPAPPAPAPGESASIGPTLVLVEPPPEPEAPRNPRHAAE